MKQTLLAIICLAIGLNLCSCGQANQQEASAGNQSFIRLLEGDNADPSVVFHKGMYYMVHSSFDYCPGLIVYESEDLVNWTPISTALTQYEAPVWAPDICVHNDRFYIYYPSMVEGGNTNLVVWTDDPHGTWSQPVDLKVGGIDPEHVVDENGKRHVLVGWGELYPLSDDGLRIVGNHIETYHGWEIPEEWDIECYCLEGINIKKIGDYYYLLAAEGGTAGPPTGHMIVQARSKTLDGTWENAPTNPLLRTESRESQWWNLGHGSLVFGKNDEIYMFFHGYQKDYITLGRQSLVCQLELNEEKWLQLKSDNIDLPQPQRPATRGAEHFVWQTFKESLDQRATIGNKQITLTAKGNSPEEASPLLFRAGDMAYEIEACFETSSQQVGAGITLFYSPRKQNSIGFRDGEILGSRLGYMELARAKQKFTNEDGNSKLWVKLRNDHHIVSAWYSNNGKEWSKYPWAYEMSGFQQNVLGDFLSLRPGFFAFGDGEVNITNITYRTLDTK